MVIDFGVKIELWCCEIAVPMLAFKSQSQPVSRKVHVGQKGGKQIQDPLLVTLLRGMEGTLRFFFSLLDFAKKLTGPSLFRHKAPQTSLPRKKHQVPQAQMK
jgi:hypothetical protein